MTSGTNRSHADGAGPPAAEPLPQVATLLDWRRRINELYAEVRRLLHHDASAAHAHWRHTRDVLFATHPQTPLGAGDAAALRGRLATGGGGLPVWDYDPALALRARLRTDVEPRRFPVATSGGGTVDFVVCGTLDLPFGRLQTYWLDAYGGGLFVPFRDTTSGQETYGGGRYLLDTVKGADLGVSSGRLVLDFNFAYSPSCSYQDAWSCPLAPPANRLEVPVRGGEQAHR